MLCSVFANLNNEELSFEQRHAISGLVKYLIYTENVRNFFIADGRKFEERVIEAVNSVRDKSPLRVYIDRLSPEDSLYESGWDKKTKNPDSAFSTFTLCDSTTKDIVMNSIDVAYIVERPDVDIYVIAKSSFGFHY